MMSQIHVTSFDGLNKVLKRKTIPASTFASNLRKQIIQAKNLDVPHERPAGSDSLLGLVDGVDPRDLSQTGWAIICNQNEDPRIIEALRPLLEYRRIQATQSNPGFYKEFTGSKGYISGEHKIRFLNRHNVNPASPADPEYMPYYLLIVGSPESVPFSFQYQLDIQYGVGRLSFDTVEGYRKYADSIISTENQYKDQCKKTLQLDFFAPMHERDPATQKSVEKFVNPLMKHISKNSTISINGWTKSLATKGNLFKLLHAKDTQKPDLLFCAGHGIVYPKNHPRQRYFQGALVCQDWDGHESGGPTSSSIFSKEDIHPLANLQGMILFLFNCFGAGTPRWDRFSFREGQFSKKEIAGTDFISGMAKSLLSHEKGGLLAMIGHIDRAWEYSFEWEQSRPYIEPFEVAIQRLINGFPVGWAMEQINQRYAELASDYYQLKESIRLGEYVPDETLINIWTACNDACNYVVLGDPATFLNAESRTSSETQYLLQ